MKMDYKQQMSAEELLTYLDTNIEHWRAVQAGTAEDDENRQEWARCYVDAFQQTRLSVFGHMKK